MPTASPFATTHRLPSPSLAGNLLGDEPCLDVAVVLPPDYPGTNVRYPVTYVLAGYGDTAEPLADHLDSATGPARDLIFVVISGANAFGGSHYTNSTVSGRWQDAIHDAVIWTDANYRTLPVAASRGIAGHSMGGAAALRIAMQCPDVFGAVYAMSPAIMTAAGAEEVLADPDTVRALLDLEHRLVGLDARTALQALRSESSLAFHLAYGTAFAPDPSGPILTRVPFMQEAGTLIRDEKTWRRWESGLGRFDEKIARHEAALRKLAPVGIEHGAAEEYSWIRDGDLDLVRLLEASGVGFDVTEFDGGHSDRLGPSLTDRMAPFMCARLGRD